MENKQEKKKLNKFIGFLILFSIGYYYLIMIKKIDLSILLDATDSSIHFNLITVNSIFAGFLFSSLSLIVGLNSAPSITKLEKTGFMKNIYFNIIFGVVSSLISIICSIITMFCKNIFTITIINSLIIPSVELLALIFTVIVFIKAVVDVNFIINSIRKSIKKSMPNSDDLKKTLDLIK